MIGRRELLGAIGATVTLVSQPATPAVTAARLNELGPENGLAARRVGLWDVIETVWSEPGAAPVTSDGLVAERVMMGSLLQEFLHQPSGEARGAVARTDLLSFNRIEGRWRYVSFDSRAPVGLMTAASSGPGDEATIELIFEPFAMLVPGTEAVGQLLRMTQVIRFLGADQDVKDQYFMPADGTGRHWLAHRYAYVRRS